MKITAGYLGYKAYQAHNGEIEWGETVEGGNRSSNAKYLNDTMQKYKEQTFGTNILDNPIPDTDKKISTTYPAGDYKPQNIYDNPITEFDKNYILTTPIQEGVAGNRLEYPDQTQDWRDYVYESKEIDYDKPIDGQLSGRVKKSKSYASELSSYTPTELEKLTKQKGKLAKKAKKMLKLLKELERLKEKR